MKDDTISRQLAIDAAKDWYEGLICGSFRGLEKRLKSLPSAQQERPTGEWIVSESEEVGALGVRCRTYTCPSCGWNHSLIISMNFCPNCGNDNRGEQDE